VLDLSFVHSPSPRVFYSLSLHDALPIWPSARLADARLVTPRAPAEHVHADAATESGHAAPDGAHAEHAEGLAEELGEQLPRPVSLPHLGVEEDDLAGDREHQAQRVLGDGEGIDAGRIADGDAAHAGRVEVDV